MEIQLASFLLSQSSDWNLKRSLFQSQFHSWTFFKVSLLPDQLHCFFIYTKKRASPAGKSQCSALEQRNAETASVSTANCAFPEGASGVRRGTARAEDMIWPPRGLHLLTEKT